MGRHRNPKLKDSDVLELWNEGCMNIEIAEILGATHASITKRLKILGLTRNPTAQRTATRYAVYDRKTTQFRAEGTVKEIAAALNRKESTVRAHLHRFRHGLSTPWEFHLVEEV